MTAQKPGDGSCHAAGPYRAPGRGPADLTSPTADTSSVEAIVRALYEGISHRAGEHPDWQRLEGLFLPGARLVPPSPQGGPPPVLTLQDFRERVNRGVEARLQAGEPRGFVEREVASCTERYGHMAHVWSTYESKYSPEDAEPFTRGINSMQLVRHDGRWWVLTILWDAERADQPIPPAYLT